MLIGEAFEMPLKAVRLLEKQIWARWKLLKAGFENQQNTQLGQRCPICVLLSMRICETVNKITSFLEQSIVK